MKNALWVEKYRPNTVNEYVFTNGRQRELVEGWIKEGSIPHLLLSGDPGTGKTTLAKVVGLDFLIILIYHKSTWHQQKREIPI